jgi:hypothetical protein
MEVYKDDGESSLPFVRLTWSVPRGQALSDFEKAEALAYSLESQFQPVDDPSVPARYSDE